MESLEFLDRLSASINAILPEGFRVEPNRRPDLQALHEASEAEDEALWQGRSEPEGEGLIATHIEVHHVPKGQSSPLAAHMADEPDLLCMTPPGAQGASGFFTHGYFGPESPWANSSDPDERLLGAALHVLDELQDSICEGMREPWPNKGVAPVPSPHGEIDGRVLRLWFEDSRGASLTLPGIPLD